MAHQLINGKAVVDWTTGDPEGDRIRLLSAYRDFIIQIQEHVYDHREIAEDSINAIEELFNKWCINVDEQIDEVPRIWIKRP